MTQQEHRPGDLPPVGTKLKARFKGRQYTAEIVQDEEAGRPMVKVGGSLFRSLSAAAQSVTKTAVNGWQFWGLKVERPQPKAKAETRKTK